METKHTPPNELRANARQIAAAPDLLEALRALLAAYTGVMYSEFSYPSDQWTAEGRDDEAALGAIAAIAKATGDAGK